MRADAKMQHILSWALQNIALLYKFYQIVLAFLEIAGHIGKLFRELDMFLLFRYFLHS